MKILIVKMSAIGDVIHTLPALCAVRRRHPEAHLAWLVEEGAVEALRGHRSLDRLLIWRRASARRAYREGDRWAPLREMLRLSRELRDTRYDLVIDFHALLKSSIWVVLARSPRKAGFGPGMEHSEGSHIFLNERVPAISMEVHALDRGLHLLRSLGIPVGPVCYDFPILEENAKEAQRLLEGSGIRENAPLVAIHPMALWPTKLWLEEAFAEVADRLLAGGVQVVFTGSESDREPLDHICRNLSRRAVRLDGRTGLKTLAAIYRRADLVISTDTGPMHLAAAVQTPVVALFGPTAPWRTGPYGSGHTVLRSGVSCSPCFRRRCLTTRHEFMACMRRITPDQVIDAVLKQLK